MKTDQPDRTRELLAAYGARRERWPHPDQALYDLLPLNPEGKALLADAATLDAQLDALLTRPADPLRPARILKVARAQARRRRLLRAVSLAYAASVVLGLSVGYGLSVDHGGDDAYGGLLIGSTVIEEFL